MENSSILTGKDLYFQLSKRDYSGSDQDLYAQSLQTMFFHFSANDEINAFFDKLEKANSEEKKLFLQDDTADEYSIDSVTIL